MKKKLIALVCALALAVGLVGCSLSTPDSVGTIGGVAAVLSQSSIKSIECVEYPELGMEAIWKITVEDFPAFILVDDKGNDFFQQLKPWCPNCK